MRKVKGMTTVKRMTIVLALAMAAAGAWGCSAKSGADTVPATAESAKETVKETIKETEKETTEETSLAGVDLPKEEAGTEAGEEARIPNPPVKDGDKILFVGNSHTYTNDLPGMFFEMAQAGGHDVDVYDLTEGSYTLKRFSDPEDELGEVLTDALKSEPWDFVVLQENTNAAIGFNAEKDMYPYARKLDGMIKDAGGQTVFLMTWTPKDGAGILSPQVVQEQLSIGYRTIAKELDALLVPGGEVFTQALKQDGDLELWGEDGMHPSMDGTYLAVCSAYALIFQETPVGNPYVADLKEDRARELQEIAHGFMLGDTL